MRFRRCYQRQQPHEEHQQANGAEQGYGQNDHVAPVINPTESQNAIEELDSGAVAHPGAATGRRSGPLDKLDVRPLRQRSPPADRRRLAGDEHDRRRSCRLHAAAVRRRAEQRERPFGVALRAGVFGTHGRTLGDAAEARLEESVRPAYAHPALPTRRREGKPLGRAAREMGREGETAPSGGAASNHALGHATR
jgi:hypothetical protein